ncbi:MAG: hypothetical protein ACYSX0_00820 [Planctomycetota bacterium]
MRRVGLLLLFGLATAACETVSYRVEAETVSTVVQTSFPEDETPVPAEVTRPCAFCRGAMVDFGTTEAGANRFICPACGADLRIYPDGTQRGTGVVDGARRIFVRRPRLAAGIRGRDMDRGLLTGRVNLGHPVGVPGQAVGLPGQAVGLPGQAVGLPGQAVTLPAQAVGLPAQAVRLPAQAVTLPAQAVKLPGQAVTLPCHSVGIPGQAVRLPGHAVGLPGQAIGGAGWTRRVIRPPTKALSDSPPGHGTGCAARAEARESRPRQRTAAVVRNSQRPKRVDTVVRRPKRVQRAAPVVRRKSRIERSGPVARKSAPRR